MLHAKHTDFSKLDESLSLAAVPHSFAASNEAVTVSAVQSVPLHESGMDASPKSYSGADMAVMALALVGTWMVVLGWALLARHLRLAKQPLLLTQQHH